MKSRASTGCRVQRTVGRAGRGQAGVTLLEVALAVFLFGTVAITLLTLIYGALVASGSHKAHVRAGERATELAEQIDDLNYVPCPVAADPNGATYEGVLDVGPDREFDEQIEQIEYLQDSAPESPVFQSGCPSEEQGAQQVTVRVTTRSKPLITKEVVLVKRDNRCPAGLVDPDTNQPIPRC